MVTTLLLGQYWHTTSSPGSVNEDAMSPQGVSVWPIWSSQTGNTQGLIYLAGRLTHLDPSPRNTFLYLLPAE